MARPRKFDEEQVLEAARQRFWSGGYAATRMDDIAEATGLGKGSLYGAFGGKQELFHRVFDDYCTSVVDAMSRDLDGDDAHAFARLSAYVHAVAAATASDLAHRGCLLAKGAAELTEHDETVAERARTTITALGALLEDDIAACQRNGDLADDVSPGRLAALVLAVLRGVEALGKAGANGDTLTDIARTALDVLPRPPGRTDRPAGSSSDGEGPGGVRGEP
ncbi:TetR/AcrR family transcriptional regulator [Streptomyces sp. NPDC058459]|uniref:TetR/AcrR family transcriptional regulator n=1 Tax=Streptomyces sp. NPDC058459 TaxID=3346508 RepID=UPI0036513709